MKQRRLLVLAVVMSFSAFAQEVTSGAQDTPAQEGVLGTQEGSSNEMPTEHYITDELTGNKVYEGTSTASAVNDQAVQSSGDAHDGKASPKEEVKASTQKPKSASSTGKSSSSQKKTQAKKSTSTSGGSKKKSASSTSGTAKKSANTSKKSTAGSGTKKSTTGSKGKTGTKSSTTGSKKQTAPKPSEKPKQQTQSASVSSDDSLPKPETKGSQALESTASVPATTAENPKTQQESQNLKTSFPQQAEPVQSEGTRQNTTSTAASQGKKTAGAKTSSGTATEAILPSAAAASSVPPDEQGATSEADDTSVPKTAHEKTVHFVSMKNSQYLDVTYPEGGWIFLGEEGDKPLLRYFGRKIAGDVTSFSLRSRAEGKTVLHFYKNTDDGVIDDYIEVEIKGKNETQDRARITPYEAQSSLPYPKDEPLSSAAPHTEELVSLSAARAASCASLLIEVKRLAQQADYGAALRLLDEFFDTGADNADEALFLQAQIFESAQEQKNIRGALDCYETIVRHYPESSLWEKANERAVYLKKFYFDIR